MRYLLSIIGGKKDYALLLDGEEAKITKAIREKRLPDSFQLRRKTIWKDNILGFTDDKIEDETPDLTQKKGSEIKSWDELRLWVHQQSWYKGKKEEVEVKASPSPSLF